MPLAKELFHPSPEEEKRKPKKKCLVQSPSSYFRGVKCPGCYKITMVFCYAQTVVLRVGCSTVLCLPTGGNAKSTLNQDDLHSINIDFSCHQLLKLPTFIVSMVLLI
uniref:40S ribosomal protein S27 n=1 Tax=Piliocolobus tephrosceles TaxID=591936 RepID=A0A8C9IVY6_9PRIM